MELQRTQQQVLTKSLVAILLATSCFSAQETRAISLFSTKPAVVAPATSGFVDFVRENQELTVFASVVLAGAISYAIYQRWFAPKSPISRIVAENQRRAQDDLDCQLATFQETQPHLTIVAQAHQKIVMESFYTTRVQSVENIFETFVNTIDCDFVNEDAVLQCERKILARLEMLEREVYRRNDAEAQERIKRAFNDIFKFFPRKNTEDIEDDKKSCEFLIHALQEYVDFCKKLYEGINKSEATFRTHVVANAEKNPKAVVSDAYKDIKAEEVKKNVELEKTIAQKFLTSVDWQLMFVSEVFDRARAQFKVLQDSFATRSQQEKAYMMEVGIRGPHGILVVVGSVIAHKICEIIYEKEKRMSQEQYQELFTRLHKNATQAFDDLSFDFANEKSLDTICSSLGWLSLEQEGLILTILFDYRSFIKGIRADMDRYLMENGCTGYGNGSPCTTTSCPSCAQPLLNWPYVIPGAKAAIFRSNAPRPLRILLNDPDPISKNSDVELDRSRLAPLRREVSEVPSAPSLFSTSSRSTSSSSSGSASSMKEDFVHNFAVAVQNDRETKKEALIKDVLKFFHGFRVRFVDEVQYKGAEDSLRKQLESDLNLVMKQDEIDEPEIRRKIDTALRNALSKLQKQSPSPEQS